MQLDDPNIQLQYTTDQIANLSHGEQGGRQWMVEQDQMQFTDHQGTQWIQEADSVGLPSQQMRSSTRNEQHHKTLMATTTRTGRYQQTNDETNGSPLSSKKRQRSQNESAFTGLTDTRYSTQRAMKSAKNPGSRSMYAGRPNNARAADFLAAQVNTGAMSGDYSYGVDIGGQLSEGQREAMQ